MTRLPATPQQRRTVFVIAILLLLAFGIAAPFGGAMLPRYVSFNPSVQAIVFVTDLITAIFLFVQYQITVSRAVLALAIGYLYTAFIVVPYTLAFPGSFTGLIGAGPQSSAWLYYFWIDGIPLGAIAYALFIIADRNAGSDKQSAQSTIFWSVALVVGLVCGLTWLSTAGIWLLPAMMDGDRYNYVVTEICTPFSIAICVIAIASLWSIRQSILDYWLMLVMLSLLLNHVIADFLGGQRYSLGFYASRGFTIVTSTLVLILLMRQVTNLHVRLANANMMLQRERNNRLMNIEAITASIVHEVKQPLTAIAANGNAALTLLGKTPPDLAEAKAGLRDILDDTHHASDALDAIRSLVQKTDEGREPIDLNTVALDVLQSMRAELTAHGVATRSELITQIPLIRGNRVQLQQVIVNLMHNAIEAMDRPGNPKRELQIETRIRDRHSIGLTLRDSGPGIDPKRLEGIFDVFMTTKTHGMGLGLAICRTIIEKHGGQLTASSDGKRGASLEVVLPIAAGDNATQTA